MQAAHEISSCEPAAENASQAMTAAFELLLKHYPERAPDIKVGCCIVIRNRTASEQHLVAFQVKLLRQLLTSSAQDRMKIAFKIASDVAPAVHSLSSAMQKEFHCLMCSAAKMEMVK